MKMFNFEQKYEKPFRSTTSICLYGFVFYILLTMNSFTDGEELKEFK